MPRYSVVPNGNGWRVTKYGSTVSNHRKKQPAVDYAKKQARKESNSEVQIHRKDGTVQNLVSYGR